MNGIPPWLEPVLHDLTAQRARSAHAWLINGAAGLGKTALAMKVAAHVVADADPRGLQLVSAGSHPDLHVLATEALCAEDPSAPLAMYAQRYLDAGGGRAGKPRAVIAVDQVRRLTAGLSTHAHAGRGKAVVITPAERMNINAANALLKVLEEPPAETLFILVSSGAHRLPATVRSRCMPVDIALPDEAMALHWLQDSCHLDGDRAQAALKLAGGAPLAAAKMAGEDFAQLHAAVREDFLCLLMGGADTDPIAAAARWKALDTARALAILQRLMVDLLRCRATSDPPQLYHPALRRQLQAGAERINLRKTYALADRVGRYLQDLEGPLDVSLGLEDLLIDLTRLSR